MKQLITAIMAMTVCACVAEEPTAETSDEVVVSSGTCSVASGAVCRVTAYDARTNISRLDIAGVRGQGPWITTVSPPQSSGHPSYTFVFAPPTKHGASGCGAHSECGGGTISCDVGEPEGGSTSCGSSGGVMWCLGFKADGTIAPGSSSGHCDDED